MRFPRITDELILKLIIFIDFMIMILFGGLLVNSILYAFSNTEPHPEIKIMRHVISSNFDELFLFWKRLLC